MLAEALPGEQVDYVRPTPDDRFLYAFGPRAPQGNILREDLPYVLRRLDAGTLAVLADRELVGYRALLLWPRP